MDFNTAKEQTNFDLIPANTIVKARLIIKGGNDNYDHMITNGKNGNSYLSCEFVILEGEYAKRRIFDKIGLSGSETWVNMGKSRIRAILESAKGIFPKDISEEARNARKINSFEELNGLDVVIKIGIERDKLGNYQDKNRVITIITPEQQSYNVLVSRQDMPW